MADDAAFNTAALAGLMRATRPPKPAFAKNFPEIESVITRRWCGKGGKAPVCPVEFTRIHDHAPDRCTVPANPFGRGMHHNVCPVLDGACQITTCPKRIIHHQRYTVFLSNGGNGFKIRYVKFWISNGFDVDGLGAIINQAFDAGGIIAVGKTHLNAEARELYFELVVSAAVQKARRNDVVTRFGERGQRQKLRRLS